MSMLIWDEPTDDYHPNRPSHIWDQHFGISFNPKDLLSPLVPRHIRPVMHTPAGYLRPWRTSASKHDTGSLVSFDKDKFQANLDVQQFRPEEISVKVTDDNTVTIEGKHEETPDEHGFISRHFVRRYVLPKGHDINKLESKLSSDGILTITAPKLGESGDQKVRSIPIQKTGQPSKAIHEKKEEKKT